VNPPFRALRFALVALSTVVLLWMAGCNRAGPNQTVIDWDLHLDVKSVQAIDRWLAGQGLATHDLFSGIHRSVPAARWLNTTPRLTNDAIPDTTVIGPVADVPAPVPFAGDAAVEYFEHPVYFILRDRTTGAELAKRELRPGYATFKTFLDSTGQGEAGFLYRGNLLLAVDLDFARGRHQSVTISVQAAAAVKSGGPSLFGR